MKAPIEPKKEDCCNSGCNPCIFDVYEKQLRLYQLQIENGKKCDTVSENAMSQLEYSNFQIIQSVDICLQHKVILFKSNNLAPGKQVSWSPGEHFLIKYSSAEQSCTRAYTPIKIDLDLENDYDFAIILKRYSNGIVSNYLYNLNVGEHTLWRGPYGHYKMNTDMFSRIIIISQGTGIAPMYSIIKNILNDEDNMTRVTLFYCCKCLNTILLRNELYTLQSYWNFKYSIHLSEPLQESLIKYHEPISPHKLTFKNLCDLKPFNDKDQFLLCGSNEFMNDYSSWLQAENIQHENIVTF